MTCRTHIETPLYIPSVVAIRVLLILYYSEANMAHSWDNWADWFIRFEAGLERAGLVCVSDHLVVDVDVINRQRAVTEVNLYPIPGHHSLLNGRDS